MKEFEKDFYAHLGLLSVKFAKVEYNLSVILGKLIGTDEDLIAVSLIEKNTLSQNIELLKKINRIRNYQESIINNLIEKIGEIKNERNLFIHGIWGSPFELENDISIICDERKIRYTEAKSKGSDMIRKTWNYNENHTFRLSYIKKQISKIDNILLSQDSIIQKLETDVFL